ncbi:hypothetical protein IM098_004806 [Escherichia coli]|nr:hypothetical protein [Escherichia coli]EGQ2094968.1 hypothetical protein [Salmonella enterica]EFB1458123.1 hypothetical protein [Escherichia coli]EFC1584153.1 hypothetical protein [Escherichia coli]EFE9639304.1 hypothetical protein [Escherichia coli]EFH5450791.1 hypothetical protein [Escherichia coli]
MASQNGNITGTICNKATNDCQSVMLTVSELPYQQPPDVDYSVAAQYWGVAFTSVIFLWLFSRGIGMILKLVKNA